MTKAMTLISGIGLGAGLMYVLDPDRGNRRRALIRDKAARTLNKTGGAIGVTSRDLSHRTRGLVSGLTTLFGDDQATDEVIVARVRSKMGRVVSHPGSVQVTASQGRVTLSGPILTAEASDLLKCVSSVKGVESVENRLELHETADHGRAVRVYADELVARGAAGRRDGRRHDDALLLEAARRGRHGAGHARVHALYAEPD
jgi:hypothetical protein